MRPTNYIKCTSIVLGCQKDMYQNFIRIRQLHQRRNFRQESDSTKMRSEIENLKHASNYCTIDNCNQVLSTL